MIRETIEKQSPDSEPDELLDIILISALPLLFSRRDNRLF